MVPQQSCAPLRLAFKIAGPGRLALAGVQGAEPPGLSLSQERATLAFVPATGPSFACRWIYHCCAIVSVLFHDQ